MDKLLFVGVIEFILGMLFVGIVISTDTIW